MRDIFQRIHDENAWGSRGSVSGPGSSLLATFPIRWELPALLKSHNITSMLDLPCGDFNWMWETLCHVPKMAYIGGDILSDLIKKNQERWPKYTFMELDITVYPLPKVDLILVRDCLVHFSYRDIITAMLNIRKVGAEFLLMTNFSGDREFVDMETGKWRPINFTKPPFNFPKPLEVINEGNKEHPDKELALWRL